MLDNGKHTFNSPKNPRCAEHRQNHPAMEMIATSKMRRAQDAGTAGRPYDQKIRQVIRDLAMIPQTANCTLWLRRREVKKIAVVHISPDRGCAAA